MIADGYPWQLSINNFFYWKIAVKTKHPRVDNTYLQTKTEHFGQKLQYDFSRAWYFPSAVVRKASRFCYITSILVKDGTCRP